MKRVLIACEESQRVCMAFREFGFESYSCDLKPCSGGFPEFHIQDDVRLIVHDSWDLIIAHPPCTYLSNAGARWLFPSGVLDDVRYNKGLAAKDFFMFFYDLPCSHVAIENPQPSLIFDLPFADQIIEPFMFGEPFSKKTFLWLRGLPPLFPTCIISDYKPFITSGSYARTHDKQFSGCSRSGGSSVCRSKTFNGIAFAMASQWGGYLNDL